MGGRLALSRLIPNKMKIHTSVRKKRKNRWILMMLEKQLENQSPLLLSLEKAQARLLTASSS